MDQQIAPGQHEDPNHLGQQAQPEHQFTFEPEPISDQGTPRDLQIPPTPEGNEEVLRQHQRHLRSSYPSGDLSEVSYHTEHTGFPGSRHSSINTEPLTLDVDQIHDAKDQAVEVIQAVGSKYAGDIFTKDTLSKTMGRVSMLEYFWRHGQDLQVKSDEEVFPQETGADVFADQIDALVEKAQEVVEANEQQQSKGGNKTPAVVEDGTGPENAVGLSKEGLKSKED